MFCVIMFDMTKVANNGPDSNCARYFNRNKVFLRNDCRAVLTSPHEPLFNTDNTDYSDFMMVNLRNLC